MLLKVRPYVRSFDSAEYLNGLANREVCLAMSWSSDYAMSHARAKAVGVNVNLAFTLPKEGANETFSSLLIPEGAPHPEAAYQFINFILRPDVIAEITNSIYYGNDNIASRPLVSRAHPERPDALSDPADRGQALPIRRGERRDTKGSARAPGRGSRPPNERREFIDEDAHGRTPIAPEPHRRLHRDAGRHAGGLPAARGLRARVRERAAREDSGLPRAAFRLIGRLSRSPGSSIRCRPRRARGATVRTTSSSSAALIHDMGDELAPFNHAEVAAPIIRPYVRPEVTWIVEQHGLFQSYYYAHHLGGKS